MNANEEVQAICNSHRATWEQLAASYRASAADARAVAQGISGRERATKMRRARREERKAENALKRAAAWAN